MQKVRLHKSAKAAASHAVKGGLHIYSGDCLDLIAKLPDASVDLIVSSPPYCIGKEYESTRSVEDFISMHKKLLPQLCRVLKEGGNFCWQIGSHVKDGVITPLDYLVFAEMQAIPGMFLRNRIIWTYGHGLHCSTRFSGRHEVVMWYSKGKDYVFNLDAVRVPQKYPGKTYSSGPNKGKLSSNPLGKNPGDVWDIPNVKANHVEKTSHPCQFPTALPQILIKALTHPGAIVFDPFMGSGTSGVAAALENRRFIGAEIESTYIDASIERMTDAVSGKAKVRPWDKEIEAPDLNRKVARRPDAFDASTEAAALLFSGELGPPTIPMGIL